jgi:hypothetical protein
MIEKIIENKSAIIGAFAGWTSYISGLTKGCLLMVGIQFNPEDVVHAKALDVAASLTVVILGFIITKLLEAGWRKLFPKKPKP